MFSEIGKKGLQLTRAVHSSNRERLESEIKDLAEQIEALKNDGGQEDRIRIREETLALHRGTLDLLNQQQIKVDELMYQSDVCEASLQKTRIELAALQVGSSDLSVNAVTETLQRTINQAKEVQEEMRNLGF